MDQGRKDLEQLSRLLSKCALTDQEQQEKEHKDYFDKVNFEERQRVLDEKRIPKDLRYHIPRDASKYPRLEEQARKTRRQEFSVHKALPPPVKFRTGNKNQKLGKAISNLGQHFQSNSKHTLGGIIEIASGISHIGEDLGKLILQQLRIPDIIKAAAIAGKFRTNQDIQQLSEALKKEFSKHTVILKQLHDQYLKLHQLTFLQSDATADGIEQIKALCLALKNLKAAPTNVFPTNREYREAVRASPLGYRGRGRGYRRPWQRGRFRGRGRFGRGQHTFSNRFNNGGGNGYGNNNFNQGNGYGQ